MFSSFLFVSSFNFTCTVMMMMNEDWCIDHSFLLSDNFWSFLRSPTQLFVFVAVVFALLHTVFNILFGNLTLWTRNIHSWNRLYDINYHVMNGRKFVIFSCCFFFLLNFSMYVQLVWIIYYEIIATVKWQHITNHINNIYLRSFLLFSINLFSDLCL